MDKIKVLFLCTGNSARSQMAEAFLRKYGSGRFEAYSAGLESKEIHPYTRLVMKEAGISLVDQRSKHLSEYLGKVHFGYVITVCAQADERCPAVFPGMGQRLHWAIDDPAAFYGTDAQILHEFRQARDEIDDRIQTWLQEQGVTPIQGGEDAAPQV
jgi:arsenate reductase